MPTIHCEFVIKRTELIVIKVQPPRHLRATGARLAHGRLLTTARQLSPPLGLRSPTARPRRAPMGLLWTREGAGRAATRGSFTRRVRSRRQRREGPLGGRKGGREGEGARSVLLFPLLSYVCCASTRGEPAPKAARPLGLRRARTISPRLASPTELVLIADALHLE